MALTNYSKAEFSHGNKQTNKQAGNQLYKYFTIYGCEARRQFAKQTQYLNQ
jgi:hypothetical protein